MSNEVNFLPDPSAGVVPERGVLVSSGGGITYSGSGDPNGVQIGSQYETYVDDLTNELYVKLSTGTGSSGWANVSSGAGGSTQVYKVSGSPEGVTVSATAQSVAYDPTTGGLWVFNGTAGTDAGWVTVLSP